MINKAAHEPVERDVYPIILTLHLLLVGLYCQQNLTNMSVCKKMRN